MKLKEIHRTATFAWSPTESIPLLASGTVAGALDESFSNDSQLEIWAPDFFDRSEYDLGGQGQAVPKGAVTTNSRFNRIAWGAPSGNRSRGIIAAGMESGELGLWDPEKILATSDPTESLIFRNNTHQGSVRGLDFNPIQTNLFSSGAINGEIYIWDMKDPSKPYSPGTRSSKLDEITALAWNRQVQYVLASASSSGYTVVWDLRGKREVVALTYGGGGNFGGPQGGRSMGGGGRRGMSDVAWHPDNATRLVTSSEDDSSPVVMVWDLRNARAPEKILTGHEKGVLSLSWCSQDADLLLSSGKDNRALCWNPQTSEIIGELPSADNWAFQVQWCPRNPDLLAAAYFDGTVGIHSLQSTNEPTEGVELLAPTPQADGSDVFDVPGFSRTTQATLSLKQPPKWLRRPISAGFGYGGKLVSVSNLLSAQGKNQSSVVHIRTVVTEPSIVERAKKLQAAEEGKNLNTFAEERTKEVEAQPGVDSASWKALLTLFRADSRDELVTMLGFSKAEIAARVEDAVEKIKSSAAANSDYYSEEGASGKPHEPVVSFAEPEHDLEDEQNEEGDSEQGEGAAEPTPSEQSASATSDLSDLTKLADGESTTTVPSLFGDDIALGTPQTDAAVDFFSSMGTITNSTTDRVQVPHVNYAHDSSVAATIGSRPSSAASEVLKSNTFKIHPTDESEMDRLITRALILGDFESAVSVCLSAERFADAILLAVKGGPELLQRTQKAYFEKRTTTLPYLRLFQSIVTNDLADIVQNADLREWQEIFVVLCTFAKTDEFANLAEQLGQRLEFHGNLSKNAEAPGAEEFRKHATLTYLAAGRLEKVVNIWIEELSEEEKTVALQSDGRSGSQYSAHAHALQTFIEKVSVFRSANKYTDTDLDGTATTTETAAVRSYKLSGLYDRYFEYADLLAAQGLVQEAVKFLKLTPTDYQGSQGSDLDFGVARARLLSAAGLAPQIKPASVATPAAGAKPSLPGGSYGYAAPTQQQPPITNTAAHGATTAPTSVYGSHGLAGSTLTQPSAYAPPQTTSATASQAYKPAAGMQYQASSYAPAAPYQAQQTMQVPPTAYNNAPPIGALPPQILPPPPPKKQDGGWNDAPAVIPERRTPSNVNTHKPTAITSPFPNIAPSTPGMPATPTLHGQPPATLPPPPRPGSVHARGSPQPQQGPSGAVRIPGQGPQGRGMSPGPGMGQGPPPAQHRYANPPQGGPPQYGPGQGAPRQTPPAQFSPQMRGPSGIQPGAPGGSAQYARPPQGQPGPYATATPPPGPQLQNAPPPQPVSQYGPPPGQVRSAPPPQNLNLGPTGPPPQNGSARGPPSGPGPQQAAAPAPPAPKGPPPPKYPPGDRSHIPDSAKRAFGILSQEMNRLKQITPPQQRRLVEDTERRLNALFDALNCETLSSAVVDQLCELTEAMAARDQQRALAMHVDLLTNGSRTDDIGLWMAGVKQLILRL